MNNIPKLQNTDYNILMGLVHDYRLAHNLPCLQDQSVDFAAFVILKLNELFKIDSE